MLGYNIVIKGLTLAYMFDFFVTVLTSNVII